ncbi:HAD-like protein [Xylaria cf. heliscus]|nr:HAD-like protein [Xylaria cf. heliscus]
MSRAQTSPHVAAEKTAPAPVGTGTETTSSGIKAVFFDFMGTCLDWHSTVVRALPPGISAAGRSRLALDWREEFFNELHARSQQGLTPEDIDVTHRRTLLNILRDPQRAHYEHRHYFFSSESKNGNEDEDEDEDENRNGDENENSGGAVTSTATATATATETETETEPEALPPDGGKTAWPAVEEAVRSWHHMTAWDDVLPALTTLKEQLGLELFVLANGTTRLQLDLARSSGLAASFDMLFSSELLGVYKPTPEAYEKALALVGLRPEQSVMVAAHAYDLRAARALGMHTVYVYRWTDDTTEDMGLVRRENKHFLDRGGMSGLAEALRAL